MTDPDALCVRNGPNPFIARLFGLPTVFIADEERANLALTQFSGELSGRTGNREVAERLFGNSVLYQDGSEHKRLRTLMRPLFRAITPMQLDSVESVVIRTAKETTQLRSISSLDFFRSLMVAVTADHYLGVTVNLATAQTLSVAINDLGKGLYATQPSESNHSRFQRAVRARAILMRFLQSGLGSSQGRGLVSAGLSTSDTLDQAITFLFAGVDTISATLSWSLTALLKSTATSTRSVDASAEVTRNAFRGALVLHPPVYFIPRGALGDVNINSTFIQKGWNVNIMINMLHDHYRRSGSRRSYMPFGRGPKQCPGQGFSLVAGPLILETLLRKFHVEASGGDSTKVAYLPGVHPTGSPRLRVRSYK